MKVEHARLKYTLAIVTRERDLAVKEKHQLQAKLENLEQVLKVGRGAAPALLCQHGRVGCRVPEWKVLETLFEGIIKIQDSWGCFYPFYDIKSDK